MHFLCHQLQLQLVFCQKRTIAEADKATSAIVGYGNKEDILRRKMPYKYDYMSIIATKNANGGILS